MHGLMVSSALATLPVVIPTGPCKFTERKRMAAAEQIARTMGLSVRDALSLMEYESNMLKGNELE